MSLTVKKVAALRRRGLPGRYLDGGNTGERGLYLIIQGRRAAHWELRFQLNGKSRWMGLGSARVFSLSKARQRAKEAHEKLADKLDPISARRAERAANALAEAKIKTFRECAEEFIAANRDQWRNPKHGAQWTATLATYAFPLLGKLSVADIDTGRVLKVLEQPVKAERGYPAGTLWTARRETASRLRGRIESILGWATVRGYRSGDNPARWSDHIEAAVAKKAKVEVEHHAALAYAELPTFMEALREREGVAARALEFTILTAARTGETIGATWDEIDLDAAIWVIPGSRMKAGKAHRVPLSDHTVKLLRSLHTEANNDHVFIGAQGGGAGLSTASMTAVLKRMARGDITVHGFRSTFTDWVAEQTAYPSEVADMALAHVVSDKVEAAYRRGALLEKRKRLAADWGRYCTSAPVATGATVTPLRGRS